MSGKQKASDFKLYTTGRSLKSTSTGTRTQNRSLRRRAPYPLGHRCSFGHTPSAVPHIPMRSSACTQTKHAPCSLRVPTLLFWLLLSWFQHHHHPQYSAIALLRLHMLPLQHWGKQRPTTRVTNPISSVKKPLRYLQTLVWLGVSHRLKPEWGAQKYPLRLAAVE